MARSNQYNPNQAGMDILKFCQQARKELIARIDPALSFEDNLMAKIAIMKMDDNELRKALRVARDPITQYYTDRNASGNAALTAHR